MPENPTPTGEAAEPAPPSPTPDAPAPDDARAPKRRISAPFAHLLAWAGLALVNAIGIALLPMPAGGLSIRALHHAYDAGHMLALGFMAWGLSRAWERFGRPNRAPAGLAVLSVIVGLLLLKRDLAGLAEQLAGEGSAGAVAFLLAAVASLSVPAALVVGARLARGRLRIAGALVAALGGVANGMLLENDYPGIHFFIAWISATLAATSITGLALPARARKTSARTRIALRVLAVALALGSLVTLLRRPSNAVLISLYARDSAVVIPLLSRARAQASAGRAAIPPAMAPWFVDRERAPDIPPSAPPILPPDGVVVLVTIDSLRADVLASNTNKNRRLLPALFRLRDESVSFELARSPGSGTRITLATVFSGKYFSQLRWNDPLANRPRLDADRNVRFPELLAKAGAATVTYVSEAALESSVGIARGFAEEQRFQPIAGQRYALARELMAAAVARLRAHRGGPLFLYMHLMDPHAPYDAAGTEGSPRDRYLREVALVDRELDLLLRVLHETGLAGRAAVIVTADHGEAFGQHNTPHHNATIYEELLRVPLLIRAPGAAPRRVAEPVSLIDLGPTVLDLMGHPTPGSFMGESLVPFLRGQDPPLTRPILAEYRYGQALIFPDGTKAILDWKKGTEEIYDLARDPAETRNLCDELGPACAERLDVLRAFFLAHARWR